MRALMWYPCFRRRGLVDGSLSAVLRAMGMDQISLISTMRCMCFWQIVHVDGQFQPWVTSFRYLA